MKFLTYRPARPLRDFVELLWLYKRGSPTHAKERLLPSGTMELVVNLSDPTAGPLLCGAQSQFFTIDTAKPATILGVHFKPGGSFPFLNLPAGDLHNSRVSLDNLWGRKAGTMHEELLEAKTPVAMFRILEQTLVERASVPLVRDPTVSFALDEFQSGIGSPGVADVIDQTGLSPRRFIQIFTEQVGLTPKLFYRIQRFQQVLRLVANAHRVNWLDVALSCGYYDQAHFINDFRAFSGLNPTSYFQVRGEHLNHVPMDE